MIEACCAALLRHSVADARSGAWPTANGWVMSSHIGEQLPEGALSAPIDRKPTGTSGLFSFFLARGVSHPRDGGRAIR